MPEVVSLFKDLLQFIAKPRCAFVVWLTCLIVLLLPVESAARDAYMQYIFAVMLFFFIAWIVELALALFNPVDWFKARRIVYQNLEGLNWYEAALLIRAVETKRRTTHCGENQAQWHSLRKKRLVQNVLIKHKSATFTIPYKVWVIICKPDVLNRMKEIPRIG